MSEWGSPEWQARNRAWLQQKMQPIDNAYRGLLDTLDYYIPGDYGGKSFGQSVDGLLNFTKEASPGADVRDMRDGSRQAMQGLLGGDMSQSLQGLGLLGLGTIGMVPGAGDVAKSVGKKARASNFKKWFGKSKVVDDAGKPLTVYHGGVSDISEFNKSKLGANTAANSAKQGFWFTDSPRTAQSYGDYAATDARVNRLIEDANKAEKVGNWDLYDKKIIEAEKLDALFSDSKNRAFGQNIMPVNLSLKNPYTIDAGGESYMAIEDNITKQIARAKLSGYDGVIIKNLDDAAGLSNVPANHYLVFDPTHIKSIHNRGTYDLKDPNILKSLAPIAGAGVVGAGLLSQEGQKDY